MSWPVGLVELATARWDGSEPPPVAGFVTSAFSPLAAAVAEACLTSYFGPAPAESTRGERTGIVLVSTTGDLATNVAVASAVQAGKRVPPLLFYQSNHNAVAGYIAARWGLAGPVVCTMPGGDAEAEQVTTLLIEDGDADAALVIAVNTYLDGAKEGTASLIGPATWTPRQEERQQQP
ncbi:MAG TPA: beta-ketoacyl synthase N-terminal-like domain-containing protein [Streptosporangiaceae bacterium]|nr:beta-ketoacyl synthase N-terminal-like domain-containing protein [Streptosporangiaceae bacterium]